MSERRNATINLSMSVGSYNKLMGGVDNLDQLRSYYGVGRALVEVPLLGYPQRRPNQSLHSALIGRGVSESEGCTGALFVATASSETHKRPCK